MAETLALLEAEYCPPIDPALLSAILSDFDLTSGNDVQIARSTLDSLRESAVLEEAAGFDASGTGGIEQDLESREHIASLLGTSDTQSKETDVASLSNQLSLVDFENDPPLRNRPIRETEELEKLDHDEKVQLLQDVFGGQFSRYRLEYTLRKCDGKWNTALEELLNYVYFGENASDELVEPINAKGIDGFAEESILPRGRKRKGKTRRFEKVDAARTCSLPGLRNESPAPAANKWKSAVEDINFIASRTGIANATVSSIYYSAGASVSKTIVALLKTSTESSKNGENDDVSESSPLQELSIVFPTISPEHLTAIIRLTHPSITAAGELATALTGTSTKQVGGIQIVPLYSRPDSLDIKSERSSSNRMAKSAASSRSPSSDRLPATARREAYDLARAAALSQAHAARRKAKSDHLMSGAASYYSQVSREYATRSLNASAQAADQLADSQSTASQLDLHGIDVRNAVRISQEKVERWWDSLGESRINGRIGAEDRLAGYRIVVGLGRHSEGGHGKLGPAVTKTLRQQGWRIEQTGAVIFVKGPVRK